MLAEAELARKKRSGTVTKGLKALIGGGRGRKEQIGKCRGAVTARASAGWTWRTTLQRSGMCRVSGR